MGTQEFANLWIWSLMYTSGFLFPTMSKILLQYAPYVLKTKVSTKALQAYYNYYLFPMPLELI